MLVYIILQPMVNYVGKKLNTVYYSSEIIKKLKKHMDGSLSDSECQYYISSSTDYVSKYY